MFAAENDALQKTLVVKEHVVTMIPCPDKGVAGSGFNLQEAMGLTDDPETYMYALLRVSPLGLTLAVCTYMLLTIVVLCPGPGS